MVAVRPWLGLATVALVYLLVVFLSAVWWGRWPSVTASVLAFLAMNFFFTVPYNTFWVASSHDVISLMVFLFVAEMTNRLVTQLREREADAQRQAWEASTLHALSHAVSALNPSEEILRAVARRIVEALGVRECAIFLPDADGRLYLYTAFPPPTKGTLDVGEMLDSALRAFVEGQPVEEAGDFCLPLRAGQRIAGVLRVTTSGGERPMSEATARLLRAFAEHTGVVIERLHLQQEQAQAEILRKTDELKSALLSAVSHDLRTPLASIRAAATALVQNGVRWEEDTRRELLEMIDAEAARLSRLVSNLLDLSRIEAGVLQPQKEWHDLQEVVARAVDYLHNRLREHRVVVDIAQDLPLVPLDFTQIEDVLVNLLENAVRHSPEGTEIQITASHRGSEVIVKVENEGPPIPVELGGQIFNRFSTGPAGRRTGVGLAICKGLIEAHGGRIWVDRPGEEGARFVFTIPLEDVPAAVGEWPARASR